MNIVVKLTVTDPQGGVTWHGVRISGDHEWVKIETVRGQAIPPGAVLPILARTGIVEVRVENGRITVPPPARLADARIGMYCHVGRSGATWERAWRLDGSGYRIGTPVAYWHVSMRGVLNEPIWGDPYMLVRGWALAEYVRAAERGVSFRVERDLILCPVPLNEYWFAADLLREDACSGDIVPFEEWRVQCVRNELRPPDMYEFELPPEPQIEVLEPLAPPEPEEDGQ